jgi:hypothetical protein
MDEINCFWCPVDAPPVILLGIRVVARPSAPAITMACPCFGNGFFSALRLLTSGRHLVPEAHLAELLDPLLDTFLGSKLDELRQGLHQFRSQ